MGVGVGKAFKVENERLRTVQKEKRAGPGFQDAHELGGRIF